ncbi:MAG: DUF4136 domain-containing protein [Bacteroidetes bacterium]|nr:DUF4136 domain-containing protein [Bacteroidota bacterium]
MKTLIYLVLACAIAATLPGCSSYNYYTAGLNKTNMSGYRSFAWLPPAGKSRQASQADLRIKDAAVASLTAKGLRMDQGNPDLLVTYTATVGRGVKDVYYPTYYGSGGFYPGWGFGFGWGWGGWYRPYYYWGGPFTYYGGMTAVDKEHYKEGTIIIDLIDTRTKRVVWRGFGVGEVHKNPQKNIEDLPKVVDGIIDQLNVGQMRRS